MNWISSEVPGVILAPMEGVTDAPMRALLTRYSSYLFCVSEFIRVTDQELPSHVLTKHVPELTSGGQTPSGIPVVVQLLGGNATQLAKSAERAAALGASAIDLNFGCPAPTVNRHDGGATLLKYPHRIYEIISAVRSAVPSHLPVSAKLRLGWDNPEDIFENAEKATAAGASWLTLHARTRMQGYAKPVYWPIVGKVREQVPIPVVANGDIWSFQDFLRCFEETGCRHYMLGRGAVGNPFLAQEITQYLNLPQLSRSPGKRLVSPQEWHPLVESFIGVGSLYHRNEQYLLRRIKQWIRLASIENPLPWFDQLKQTQTLQECLYTLKGHSH